MITATITAIDPKIPSISLSGPNNWNYSSRVADKEALKQVKVGDELDITWTEAVLLSVDAAEVIARGDSCWTHGSGVSGAGSERFLDRQVDALRSPACRSRRRNRDWSSTAC